MLPACSTHQPIEETSLLHRDLNSSSSTFDGKTCPAYKPKDRAIQHILDLVGKVAASTMEAVLGIANQHCARKEKGGAATFYVDPKEFITESFKNSLPPITTLNAEQNKLFEQTLGTTLVRYQTGVGIAKRLVTQFFENQEKTTFPYSSKNEELRARIQATVLEILHASYLGVGICCEREHCFLPADLEAFAIEPDSLTTDLEKIHCLAFALLQTRETRAKNLIFNPGSAPFHQTLCKLTTWNYVPIETPQEGDLVLYSTSSGKVEHVGYYLGSGEVRSKFGINNPHVYRHGLFKVPSHYGTSVMFLRKPSEKERR